MVAGSGGSEGGVGDAAGPAADEDGPESPAVPVSVPAEFADAVVSGVGASSPPPPQAASKVIDNMMVGSV